MRVEVCMQFFDVFWKPFMGMSCFYSVCWQVCDILMHFSRVCWTPFMGMSYFLVQKWMRIIQVSLFRWLLLTGVANLMFCVHLFAYFAHICVILCLCVAVCGRQFLSRVDIFMQFYSVFWEPFMGMSCFFVETWTRIIKVSCFSVHFCSQLSPISCFVCICLHILLQGFLNMRWLLHAFLLGLLKPAYGNVVFSRSKLHAHHKNLVFFRSLLLPAVANLLFYVFFLHVLFICVRFRAYVLQFVAGSCWVELIF